MARQLRCACCGETDSSEGFLRVEKGGVLDGRRLNDGDTLRVECARRLGFEIPAPTHPPLTFRAT